MSADLRQSYLQREIMEASGHKLVLLLYRAAVDSIAKARLALQSGDIPERFRLITKTSEILNELALSVDHDAGGELSKNLVELYAYIQTLLQRANLEQIEEPLVEASSLVQTLLKAWEEVEPSVLAAPVVGDSDLSGTPEYAPVNIMG